MIISLSGNAKEMTVHPLAHHGNVIDQGAWEMAQHFIGHMAPWPDDQTLPLTSCFRTAFAGNAHKSIQRIAVEQIVPACEVKDRSLHLIEPRPCRYCQRNPDCCDYQAIRSRTACAG